MRKRKSAEDKAHSEIKPRKRRPFTTPKASIKAIIEHNASSSPLLRLPLEIRDRIWTEVLGGRLVHLRDDFLDHDHLLDTSDSDCRKEYRTRRWRHEVCQHDCPEDQPDERVMRHEGGELSSVVHTPHLHCNRYGSDDDDDDDDDDDYDDDQEVTKTLQRSDRSRICLAILRSCHQIYVEANQVLWTTNAFSFTNGLMFDNFMSNRNIGQRRLIRNLRFEMNWRWGEEKAWNSALSLALVRSLTGLRTLRLQIHYDMEEHLWHSVKDRFLQMTSYCDGLRKLSTLPLTSAEVMFRTSSYRGLSGWRASDRTECAKRLQDMLLDPRGTDIYAQQQAALKETGEMSREIEEYRRSLKTPLPR